MPPFPPRSEILVRDYDDRSDSVLGSIAIQWLLQRKGSALLDHSEQKSGVPLRQNWIVKAEYELEALRKRVEMERDSIRNEFHAWLKDDVRRWTISRLSTIFLMPVLGLYIMRVHLSYPEWWEGYANGAPPTLFEDGRTELDRHLKGKLLIDLAGNLEHSFRCILKQLDPQTRAADFSAIYASLLRQNNPYLQSPPPDSLATLDLLRLIRNTIHNSWAHYPESGENREVPFKGATYSFIVGKKLDFVSWDLLLPLLQTFSESL